MVAVRRFFVFALVLLALALVYFVASAAVAPIHRSGGCDHIPLTASGQPTHACSL